jgi:glycosyltransferase involved in cell wall biosynthesis
MLAPEFPPVLGGVGVYAYELAKRMPKGIELHILTPLRRAIDGTKASSADYYSSHFGDNIHVHFISVARDTFFYNAAFQWACMKYVPKLAREHHIDLIHSHTAHMPDILLGLRGLRIPILTTIHTTIRGQQQGTRVSGTPFAMLSRSEKATLLFYPFLRLAEEVYFRGARFYVTQSRWMRDQIVRNYPRLATSVVVVPTSVDAEIFCPLRGVRDESQSVILFTGRLLASKGLEYMIRAIPVVLSKHPNAFFVFAGPGDSGPYEAKLVNAGVNRRSFAFLGYLANHEQLVAWYRSASMFAAPTLYENLPATILEAMACETPAVASNVCGIPEAIQHSCNGILIPPRSTRKLAESLCYLIENPTEVKRMGKNARKTVVGKFSYEVNAHRILDIYKAIVGELNPRSMQNE